MLCEQCLSRIFSKANRRSVKAYWFILNYVLSILLNIVPFRHVSIYSCSMSILLAPVIIYHMLERCWIFVSRSHTINRGYLKYQSSHNWYALSMFICMYNIFGVCQLKQRRIGNVRSHDMQENHELDKEVFQYKYFWHRCKSSET